MAVNLTEGDRKILSLAWHCFETQPKVNYKKLQEMGGYKTAASATAVYLSARKKLLAGAPVAQVAGVGATTPKGTGGKKRAATDNENSAATPSKKRGRKGKTATPLSDAGDAEQDDEESKGEVNIKKEVLKEGDEVDEDMLKGAYEAVQADDEA